VVASAVLTASVKGRVETTVALSKSSLVAARSGRSGRAAVTPGFPAGSVGRSYEQAVSVIMPASRATAIASLVFHMVPSGAEVRGEIGSWPVSR
jgi:hypothetical protein